ncbi:sensor histidine kinase [Campylobacter mucosalis]|uniref:histidine kinase n=1 Tax=Campylobacter mucosalis CCUG 21559 TaxID=1032067 RepID=A0A6G5QGQ8_9BACT|nr:HAMP domain-containing sensor histidine kinase [Campylobacter mucosalis]QCD44757.1 two-component system sensor histidine kinase [Campylobacter mucosalis CCUG 21559]
MQKIKIPLLAIFIIMALFGFQSYIIVILAQKNEVSNATFGIMKFESTITKAFEASQTMPTSLIYRYAILSEDNSILFSNLKEIPPELKDSKLIKNGRLYYKNFFFKNNKPYYIIISQELNDKRNIFLSVLMFSFMLIVVIVTLYLSYYASIKPYKQAQKYLNDFFNDAMHELKTPLGVAKINLEMLGLENKYTKRINNALKQMQIAYDDVEYFIKRGYIKFPKERVELSEFIRERVRFIASIADIKSMKIVLNLNCEFFIEISKISLQRLIDNNLTNAIKYSHKDSEIIVSLEPLGDGVVFSVQDFGVGIRDVKQVFKRYEREDSVQGGFGIGLSIVREICVQNNILYRVKTKLGEGSTFFYEFKSHQAKVDDALTKSPIC